MTECGQSDLRSRSRLLSAVAGGEIDCLVCSSNVDRKEAWKVLKFVKDFGRHPFETFLKICELLQVPFSEIQDEWRFRGDDGVEVEVESNDRLPFCLVCLNGFQSLFKLQQEVKDIQRRIQVQTNAILGKIRASASKPCGDSKTHNFRLRVLANQGDTAAPAPSSSSTLYFPSEDVTTTTATIVTTAGVNSDLHGDEEPGTFDNENHFNDSYYDSQENDNTQTTYPKSKPLTTRTRNETPPTSTSITSNTTLKRVINTSKPTTKRERHSETFSPIITDAFGKMTYENIPIIPAPNGYTCGKCFVLIGKSQDSISLRKIKIHIKGFHLNSYKCPLCSKNFTSNDIISRHLIETHSTQVPCPICAKPIKKSGLQQHQYLHMNSEEKKIARASGLKLATDYKKPPTIPCKICEKLFRTQSLLKKHELSHIEPKFRRDFKCNHCEKYFATKANRRLHIQQFHDPGGKVRKRLCKICGVSVWLRNFASHMRLHFKRSFSCDKCGKIYTKKEYLQRHENNCGKPEVRKPGFDLECDICHKYYKTKRDLYLHRHKIHKDHWKSKVPARLIHDVSLVNPVEEMEVDRGGGPLKILNNEDIQFVEGNIYSYQLYKIEKMDGGGFKCLTCLEEIFGGDEDVKEHIKSNHIGSYRCNKCTKRMKTISDMEVHQKKEHWNFKAFKGVNCKTCGKPEIYKRSYKRHLWMHMNVWEVADAVNSGESFPVRYTTCNTQGLLKDMGVEINLRCVICEMEGFDKVEELYSHRVKEHPDAPKIRVRRYKGKDRYPKGPFPCPECGKIWKKNGCLTRHLRMVHGKNGNPFGPDGGIKKKKMEEIFGVKVKEEPATPDISDDEEDKDGRSMKAEVEEITETVNKKRWETACEICGELGIPKKSIKKHCWMHMNVWEVADAVNSGESFPSRYTTCKTQTILKKMGVDINLECVICKKKGFDKVEDLYSHRRREHPDAPKVKVVRFKAIGREPRNPKGPFPCPECGKIWEKNGCLTRHLRLVHGKEGNPLSGGEGGGGGGGGVKTGGKRKIVVITEEDEMAEGTCPDNSQNENKCDVKKKIYIVNTKQ